MYDLRGLTADGEPIVIEVTAARDPVSSWIENAIGESQPLPSGYGLWLIELQHGPPARDMPGAVREVIELARSAGVAEWELGMGSYSHGVSPEIRDARLALDARMGSAGFSRICHITTWIEQMVADGVSGVEVPTEDEARIVEAIPLGNSEIMSPRELVEWLEEYIEKHPDLRAKTGGDEARQRHLYLYIDSHIGSVRPATLLAMGLTRRLAEAESDTVNPDPGRINPYTHIWLAPTGGGIGVYWDGDLWRLFTALPERE